MSYGELDRRARAIAALLQERGIAGGRALLLYPPGLDFIAGFFGCLYAGVVAVPAYTPDPSRLARSLSRLQVIISDAQAAAVLTDSQIAAATRAFREQAPAIESLSWIDTLKTPEGIEETWREPRARANDVAFLQYTSGSTGAPKGVMLSHANLLHNAALVKQAIGHEEGDRYISWLPAFHDMGFMAGVLQPLYADVPVVLMSPVAFLQKPYRWLKAISDYKGSISGAPNFAYDLCSRKISAEQKASLDLSHWLVAFNGAEPIRAETLDRFAENFARQGFRKQAFYPCYGLAEATLIVSGGGQDELPIVETFDAGALERGRVENGSAGEDQLRRLVSCGRALPQQQIIIVNPETLVACSPDEIGEIWVSGPSVGEGYWNRAPETEETFRAYLSGGMKGPFLRTGDLGFIKDEELFIAGRLKDLIIIRGLNHYPQDIELTVESCYDALRPGCCAAFSVEAAGEERLVIVQEIDSSADWNRGQIVEAIRRAVADKHDLQVYAVSLLKPGAIPKTSSGKIQRKACRTAFLEAALDEVAHTFVEDSIATNSGQSLIRRSLLALGPEMRQSLLASHLQQEMAAILKINPASLDLDKPVSVFGLDSLASVELRNTLESTLGLEFPLTTFLQDLSLKELASQILERLDSTDQAPVLPPTPTTAPEEFPCSHGQKALWFINQMAPESAAYNLAIPFRVRGAFNVRAWQTAFEKLLRRHACLSATFFNTDQGLAQRVQPQTEVFDVTDASAWSRAALDEALAEEAQRPFDLERGPVVRGRIYRCSDDEHILLMTVHHIAADLWSLVIVIDELSRLYKAEKSGSAASLPPAEYQYADHVRWQEEMLAGTRGEGLRRYWRRQLAGELQALNLPTDYPHPPAQTFRGAAHLFHLDAELALGLNDLARREGATLYMVLVAAFLTLLHRYTGQEDVLLGTPSSGRTRSELAGVVGYFINPVVLRAHPAGGRTFRNFLSEARRTVLDALEHQDYPFPLLVEKIQPNRDPRRSPLFQAMFILEKPHQLEAEGIAAFILGDEGKQVRLRDLVLEPVALKQTATQFELALMMVQSGGSLSGALQYNTDLFAGETIQRMAGHFGRLLESIVENPNRRLAELPILTETERARLLIEWNETRQDDSGHLCLHEMYRLVADESPDRVAAVFDPEQITHAELNDRANRLAHYLRRHGAGPEQPVGIYLERGLDMMVALLAVLKAGAAYLPMDTAHPTDFLDFILEDAGVSTVISHSGILGDLAGVEVKVVSIDGDWEGIAQESKEEPETGTNGENLAYVIYTSGSTGRPKGVMVSHSNVANFFAGMDRAVGVEADGTWLAVTSASFDISVLELLWTLARGYKVVIQPEQIDARPHHIGLREGSQDRIEFSLFYFASDDQAAAREKYRLLLEGSKFADRHGFSAIWTPERHFHAFGGLYPNPSLTSAALAAITKKVRIRAGSVVLPLHDPLRIAEDWAVIDNLSGGRAAVSFASGWHADDFVLAPDNYARRKQIMVEGIETIRKLWRGEPVVLRGGAGNPVEVAIHPRPVQPELPVWITAAGNTETFQLAGELGAGLLTHLLGQDIEELEEKIRIYRESYRKNHAGRGHVTLMLHTFLGRDPESVRETVRKPFRDYLATSFGLMSNLMRSLGLDAHDLAETDREDVLSHAFDKYFETSGLFGTPKSCLETVERLKAIGCDEIACLIDFGVEYDSVIEGLRYLEELKRRSQQQAERRHHPAAQLQIERHGVSHLQCTPSMAAMLAAEPGSADAFGSLRKLLIGGEAFPPDLAERLGRLAQGEIYNMYGPTETTIWSATHRLDRSEGRVSIGRPIVNTCIYIVDELLYPKPAGVGGELLIGGRGVARGYLNRPDLTAERFIPDPFGSARGARLYRSGDLARYLPRGDMEFLGRVDDQVKIRGHRIEPGEIEALLNLHEGISQSVVIARPDAGGNQRLVAYVVRQKDQAPLESELRAFLRRKLPEYMTPSIFVPLDEIPLTPNGKIDRRALPDPGSRRMERDVEFIPPGTPIEEELAAIWKVTLGIEAIGVRDDFFNAGGHSIIATQIVSRIRRSFAVEITVKDFFASPNIEGIAQLIEREILATASSESIDEMLDLIESVDD